MLIVSENWIKKEVYSGQETVYYSRNWIKNGGLEHKWNFTACQETVYYFQKLNKKEVYVEEQKTESRFGYAEFFVFGVIWLSLTLRHMNAEYVFLTRCCWSIDFELEDNFLVDIKADSYEDAWS